MVAAFDIGNSNLHLGLYHGKRLIRWSAYPLHKNRIESTLQKMLAKKNITGAAIASVAPKITPRVVRYLRRQYKIVPLVVSAELNCYLRYAYRKPTTLGADRIANAVGGIRRYKKDLLIISFGTATTLDVVLKNGHHLGGIIAPGMDLFLTCLAEKTALLKSVTLRRPKRYVGSSTEACVQSGVVNGSIAMIKGLIKAVRSEVRKRLFCVATGGWGRCMTEYVEEVDRFDKDLTTFGVLKIYEDNA